MKLFYALVVCTLIGGVGMISY